MRETTIFVLLEYWDYEGSDICSIHKTRSGAEAAKPQKRAKNGHGFHIEEIQLED